MRTITILGAGEGRSVGVLGVIITFKLGGAQTEGVFALMFDRVNPHCATPMHRQRGDETFIIQVGELDFHMMQDGSVKTVKVGPGTVIHVPAGLDHGYSNTTESCVKLAVLL